MYFIKMQWLNFGVLELRSAHVGTSDAAIIYLAVTNNTVEFFHNCQRNFAATTLLSAVHSANVLVT
jgi:hypothetical protein